MSIHVNPWRCATCGACVGLCPSGALTLDENRLRVEEPLCTDCGICEPACPLAALSFDEPAPFEGRPLRPQYDIIVIGAGPAGSFAAATAAEAGARVLLLEKRQEIGSPVRCAEGVARDALQAFLEPDPRWTATVVERAQITVETAGAPLGLSAEGGKGYILERRLFDRFLAERAAAAGAHIRVKTPALGLLFEGNRVAGVRALVDGTERSIGASIVIGADGVESWVGRWAGLTGPIQPRLHMTCAQYLLAGIDIDPHSLHYWIDAQVAPGGYVWAFPKGAGKANVGLGIQADCVRVAPAIALNRFIESRPELARGSPVTLITGAVPIGPAPDRLVGDGVMLIGDAASQVDPLTGGGIIPAMTAGRLAGQTAAAAIRAGCPDRARLEPYERAWRAGPGRALARNQRFLQRFPPTQRASEEFLRVFAMAAAGA
jgi:digeranylgeranylglycerophospholipid reductase